MSKKINRNVKNLKKTHKIQEGKIIYSDLNKVEKPLFSKKYRITGKPDYIVNKNNHLIPVEIKTGNHYDLQNNHMFQLAAYCQILEENYGGLVSNGILVYTDTSKQYEIPFNPKLRFELESTIKSMRSILKTNKVSMNHNNINRCRSCSMRVHCNQKIV